MSTILNAITKFLSGTKAQIEASTVVPQKGQPVAEVETGKIRLKVGDGVTQIRNLNYIGNTVYSDATPTTITLGGITKASNLKGLDLEAIIKLLLTPYQAVSIASVVHTIPDFEVGYTATGTATFTVVVNNSSNLKTGVSNFIYDPAQELIGNGSGAIGSTLVLNYPLKPAIRKTVSNIPVWIQLYGINGELPKSTIYAYWKGRVYYASRSYSYLPTATEIKAMGSTLKSSAVGTYGFTSGYGYICIPVLNNEGGTIMASPAINNFRDPVTNLNFAVVYLGTKTVNNTKMDITYHVYRTAYKINGDFNIQIV